MGFLLHAITLTGQNNQFSFTFKGLCNNEQVDIDSVYIYNFSQQCETTIYYPDTVLLTGTTGVQQLSAGRITISGGFPNPFTGKTKFIITLAQNSDVLITARDIYGNILSGFKSVFTKGKHSFYYYAGSEGYSFITVKANDVVKSLKMLNLKRCNSGTMITYTGIADDKI